MPKGSQIKIKIYELQILAEKKGCHQKEKV